MTTPNPGGAEAVALGCKCPVCGFTVQLNGGHDKPHTTPIHLSVRSNNGHDMLTACNEELDSWTNPPNWTFTPALATCEGCRACE